MRWSRTLVTTLRDDPQEAEIASHKLMVRASLIRRLSGGLYSFLPLGLRALHKVMAIVREEMNRAAAQEILMPALQPADLWERSGRLATMGPGMFRLKDRTQRLMALGPTHEEVVTSLLAAEVASYRQLPCTVYQIQTKFRDEIRPRFGLMRAKEFIMKDAYSFDTSMEAADASYQAMFDAYTRIFKRCGLQTRAVEADTGDIGGKWSHEFMVLADSGEDGIVECAACGYAANQERAERRVAVKVAEAVTALPAYREVPTPNARTIEELTRYFSVPAANFIKTLLYLVDGKPVAVLLPGDRELNEAKLKRLLNAKELSLADEPTIEEVTGAPVGFAGPVDLAVPLYADSSLQNSSGMVAGANKADTHLVDVAVARDVKGATFADLVIVGAGDACPHCAAVMQIKRGIEVGHVFKLGTKYSEAFEATFLNDKGQNELMVMGCYGIGVTRTLQAVIEQNHDKDGIIWPVSVAPFTVALLLLDPKDATVCQIVDDLEKALQVRGIDLMVDDREERPGVKFKDADLIGAPIRVVVGAKGVAKGGVEIKLRTSKESVLVPVAEAADAIAAQARTLLQALDAS